MFAKDDNLPGYTSKVMYAGSTAELLRKIEEDDTQSHIQRQYSGEQMRNNLDRMLAAVVAMLLLVGVVDLRAQGESHEEHGPLVGADGSVYTCGSHYMSEFDHAAAMERTRERNPEMYAKIMAMAEGKRERPSITAADEDLIIWTFNMSDRDNPGQYTQVDAKLVHRGDSILIWVDVRDTNHVRQSTVDALAVGLEQKVRETSYTRDANTGIVGNDIAIFGPTPAPVEDVFPGYICSFFLTDISEGQLTGGIIEGYFSPWDQTTNPGSNRMNILYIDSREGLGNQTSGAIDGVIGTMAHEFQHLINHGRYTGVSGDASTHWIYNEGLSEVAAIRNGYSTRKANNFTADPNRFSFFTLPTSGTDGNIVLIAYSRAMLYTHYLSERFGDAFLYELTAAGGVGLAPTRKAMEKSGLGSNAEEVYSDFWVANYLISTTNFQGDPKYLYSYPVHGSMARETLGAVPSSPVEYTKELVGHGAHAQRFINNDREGTGMKVTFKKAGRPYGVHAILTRDGGAIEVTRLEVDREYTFENFIQIAFTVANVGSEGVAVTWNVSGVTLGVDDYRSAPDLFAVTQIAPNPTTGTGVISFTNSEPTTVRAEIFDVRGEQVGTIADDYRAEIGTHTLPFASSTLTPGVYTIRLQDGRGNVAVRQVVVVR